jgi:hypothetical protein
MGPATTSTGRRVVRLAVAAAFVGAGLFAGVASSGTAVLAENGVIHMQHLFAGDGVIHTQDVLADNGVIHMAGVDPAAIVGGGH